jgi:uncharacterized protein YecE (DUF72 family)
MDFGRVPEHELNGIDFALPPDPADNKLVLKGTRIAAPQIYIGCPRWGTKEWIGKIYPKGIKDANYLDQYIHHFNSIELNATHYKIYTPEEIGKWAARTAGKEFKFCPKMLQLITHYSNFNNVFDQTSAFLEGVLAFGKQLGPIFIQVSEKYAPNRRDALFNYLRSLPTDLPFFLEVRHPDWFADPVVNKELFDTLRSLNMGAVITDTAGRRDCAHMHLSVPKILVRFVGNSLHPTDYPRIDEWVARIKYWLDNGLEQMYFFMHMPNETFCPELTALFIDKLNPACGLDLKKPVFLPTGPANKSIQVSLFD